MKFQKRGSRSISLYMVYKIYDEYREAYNNTFLANGNVIKRFKTMSENKIKNGDKIQLQDLNEE